MKDPTIPSGIPVSRCQAGIPMFHKYCENLNSIVKISRFYNKFYSRMISTGGSNTQFVPQLASKCCKCMMPFSQQSLVLFIYVVTTVKVQCSWVQHDDLGLFNAHAFVSTTFSLCHISVILACALTAEPTSPFVETWPGYFEQSLIAVVLLEVAFHSVSIVYCENGS